MTLAAMAGFGLALAGPAQLASAAPSPGASDPASVSVDVTTTDTAAMDGEGVEDPAVAPFTVNATKYGGTITRATVIKRAQDWYKRNVPYNQKAYAWDIDKGKKYRTDCSGFVSMTWGLTSSRTTSTLGAVSTSIKWANLKPGDMVLRKGHHAQVFHKWTSSAHTSFWIYEEGSTASDMNHRKVTVKSAKAAGYKPYKYKKIK